MQDIRKILNKIIAKEIKGKKVALLFSGGVDSLTCGMSANDLGKEVIAYTFQVDNNRSPDSIASEEYAKKLGWKFNLIKAPSKNIYRDFLELANKWKCIKKTHFECTWPFLYVIPRIREKYVLTGVGADQHYGLNKNAMIHHIHKKKDFDAFRNKRFNMDNPAASVQLKMLCSSNNKILSIPYLNQMVYDYFIRFSWNEIHKPFQKALIVNAYAKEFEIVKRRRHLSAQLAARIPSFFERLLDTDLNKRDRKRIMDLCRDYSCENTKQRKII